MNAHRFFLRTLAEICLQDEWQKSAMIHRIQSALATPQPWVTPIVQSIFRRFPEPPTLELLWLFLLNNKRLVQQKKQFQSRFRVYPLTSGVCRIVPDLPPLDSVGALCRWLNVTANDLEWFADRNLRAAKHTSEKIRHYRLSTRQKRSGGLRLLEIPKPSLKQIQQRILHEILSQLPLHPAAHGFYGQRTAPAHARLHTGKPVVLRFDLSDCFLHAHGGMVFSAFRSLGFPDEVSNRLMALCTHRLPLAQANRIGLTDKQQQLAVCNHLPQGAPSSPLLSHFCLAKVDKRLTGYARVLNATYSRYADDLVFSGDVHLHRQFHTIELCVASIVSEEGFSLNFRKSACLTQARQQQVAGVVVNQHPNVPRDQFDQLKAELYNCAHKGWQTQIPYAFAMESGRYQAHLRGRIAWAAQLNPTRAAKLEALFQKIIW